MSEGRERSLANLNQGHPDTLDPSNRRVHGAWAFVRRGMLPAGELGNLLCDELDTVIGEFVAGLGGEMRLSVVDRIELEQLRTARGACRLLEAWAAGKATLTHPKHGRLPRAISEDWHKFAKLERDLVASLRSRFVDNQQPADLATALLEVAR
jgi:hypothetical protein